MLTALALIGATCAGWLIGCAAADLRRAGLDGFKRLTEAVRDY